jgi:hypothetical protein
LGYFILFDLVIIIIVVTSSITTSSVVSRPCPARQLRRGDSSLKQPFSAGGSDDTVAFAASALCRLHDPTWKVHFFRMGILYGCR